MTGRTLEGILWVLRSGARWKDLPPKYGSRSTCHQRLKEWQDQGVGEQQRLKFLIAWTIKPNWTGMRLFWMAALSPLKKGRGYRLRLER